ncbi:MAG TPA: bifunctional diguanylate cyclase/phosphodiesterase [Xanthobacteraceae bacterium]|nr:bifunctional diguanylate cyclase/phosphodiesterase [Xanthobacteraceae bacterium]
MMPSATTSIRRNIGAFAAIFLVLIGGTWLAVRLTVDHLLYQSATNSARHWAHYLAESVGDLEQIAAGEQPSAASLAFLRNAGRSGVVFRYEIFNRYGFSQLASDHETVKPVDLSEYNADAAAAIASGRSVVGVHEGSPPVLPSYYARAYVPVRQDGEPVAVVAAYVDQTAQRNELYATFLLAAAALCLLTALSFGIPAVAWYLRTREKQHAEGRIRYLARHDALTGLANRAHATELLERELAVLPATGTGLAVHFLNLDHFKQINDTLGNEGGDFLLKTVAERMQAVSRAGDVVAHLGGDEFLAIQVAVHERQEVEQFAHRLMTTVSAPMVFKEHPITPEATIGVAVAPADGATAARIVKSAGLALHEGKRSGRNCIRFFKPEMDQSMQARLRMEKIIRDAAAEERFELNYQPIFQVHDRKLVGFEALLRLKDESGTPIPPASFIPVAEDIRLIGKIGEWVVRRACLTAMMWPSDLTVAINLSPAQFESEGISRTVAAALRDTGLEAHRLELEITESLLLHSSEPVSLELTRLKELGVAIVMDDFGTGYSSLSYLWRFPFDKIKIDRSFMQGLDSNGRHAATVVKTIIALGRELHMRVTVEGVETEEHAVFLERAHADLAQGFYFGRPMPAEELGAFMLKMFRRLLERPRGAEAG